MTDKEDLVKSLDSVPGQFQFDRVVSCDQTSGGNGNTGNGDKEEEEEEDNENAGMLNDHNLYIEEGLIIRGRHYLHWQDMEEGCRLEYVQPTRVFK